MTVEAKAAPTRERLVLRPSSSYLRGYAGWCFVPFALLAGIEAALGVQYLRFSIIPVVLLSTGWSVFVARSKVVIDRNGVELERSGHSLAWPAIRSIEVAPRGRGGRKSQIYVMDRMGQRSALLTWGPDWRHWHWTATEVHVQLGRIEEWCAAHGIPMPPVTDVSG